MWFIESTCISLSFSIDILFIDFSLFSTGIVISPLPELTASEFDDAMFCCAPFNNTAVEVKGPDDDDFTLIDTSNTRLMRETDLDNNHEVFTYSTVTRADNGTQFFCSLVGVEQTRVTTLIVYCKY